MRGALGLLPVPRGRRSAGRYQYAVAALRRGQPDARGHRADSLQQRARQDETRALCLGDAGADRVATRHDAHRRHRKDLP